MIFEVTHWMALLPLAFLGILTAAGLSRGAAWWWLAMAFAVSWIADSAAHYTDPWRVSLVYPVAQAALVCAVLLDRGAAWTVLWVLVVAGVIAAVLRGDGPHADVLLRWVAWGTVAGIAFLRPELGRLRRALVVSFGLGLIAWMCYVIVPGWWTWGAYQVVRAIGLLLFCHAAWYGTTASLKIVRGCTEPA